MERVGHLLGDRGVEDAVLPVLLPQALRAPEDPAERHVLSEDRGLLTGLERHLPSDAGAGHARPIVTLVALGRFLPGAPPSRS